MRPDEVRKRVDVMVIEMEPVIRIQILDRAICVVSHSNYG